MPRAWPAIGLLAFLSLAVGMWMGGQISASEAVPPEAPAPEGSVPPTAGETEGTVASGSAAAPMLPVPPGTEADLRAEWAPVRAAILAGEPGAMEQARSVAARWAGLVPPPPELLEVQSIAHLVDVEDAARSLR